LKEEKIKEVVKRRSSQQNRIITIKRYVVAFLSVLWLFVGWALIYFGAVYENEMNDWVSL